MCCWSYTEIDYKLLIFSCTRWIDNATWDSLCSVKFYLKNSNVKVRAFNHRVQVIIHRHHTTPGHLSKVIRFQPVPCWNIVIITKNTSDSQTHKIMEVIHPFRFKHAEIVSKFENLSVTFSNPNENKLFNKETYLFWSFLFKGPAWKQMYLTIGWN